MPNTKPRCSFGASRCSLPLSTGLGRLAPLSRSSLLVQLRDVRRPSASERVASRPASCHLRTSAASRRSLLEQRLSRGRPRWRHATAAAALAQAALATSATAAQASTALAAHAALVAYVTAATAAQAALHAAYAAASLAAQAASPLPSARWSSLAPVAAPLTPGAVASTAARDHGSSVGASGVGGVWRRRRMRRRHRQRMRQWRRVRLRKRRRRLLHTRRIRRRRWRPKPPFLYQ